MQTLHLTVKSPLPKALLRPFQKGVGIEVKVGDDLLHLLTEDLCLTDDGIAKIQTIFWQGKPVDDIAACTVRHGGVLALSAALPGLVGACLRRDGFWSGLRDSISHEDEGEIKGISHGVITVKLFNFMLAEVGPLLLERGVLVDTADVSAIMANQEVDRTLVKAIEGQDTIEHEGLKGLIDLEKTTLLRVEIQC